MTSHQYDVVLYGATGFTGSLAAQYLAAHPQNPRLAFAGRNEAKIRDVISKLKDIPQERRESIGVIKASMDDKASLKHMAQSAKVVLNMVGPYAMLGGFEVAQAAAENGCGYVDLAGESNVYERVAKELHSVAQSTKAILVPSSGFDSLPFDLSTYLAVQQVKQSTGPSTSVKDVLLGYHVQGTVSGGTIASLVEMGNESPNLIKYTDLYMGSPIVGTQKPEQYKSRKLPQFDGWGGYSLFAPHNTRVVNRSWGLLQVANAEQQYGKNFTYLEGLVASSRITAVSMSTIFINVARLVSSSKFFGKMLTRHIPQGSGGSMKDQLKGFADLRTVATSEDGKTKGLSTMKIKGDPGYLKTAAMISETTLAIALDREHLSPLAQQGGVLTPATIGGEHLRDRLVKYADIQFTSKDVSDMKKY
ncbi:hypothetical protein MVES1_000231 [Malassezia vespertilionis]|uniref:Saccharopine dehydrogenase NADP binding domain-containing protein n=1 Tax=Malassezia vespertilionis TaxID=2020962 RepID=A0A2N1JFL8_9BASI|nr:uncharacterized protein MVES1_000231 [Malassezia vespertilionis]PKI85333.1 hypothetical protein MVES_000220 [Malassezia vespertilionis]WFD04906.1 hypothetical protein MVES1_000231 [Malassezia vespertilionis]